MKFLTLLAVTSLLFTLGVSDAFAGDTDIYLNSERPAADIAKDANRKPKEVLAFFDIQADMQVLDLFSGGGYYTEMLSHIVGKQGKVDAHNNAAYLGFIGADKLEKRYGGGRLANVQQLVQEANDLQLCMSCYDRVMMVLTFHDLYYEDAKNGWSKIDAPTLMKKVLSSLKPGGIVGIVDHIAPSGSGEQAGQTLHRIDPLLIKDKMKSWGFRFIEEANFLQNPADEGDLPMWDPSIKGKTSRAVMKFAVAN
jgi:predicted methyltransferase